MNFSNRSDAIPRAQRTPVILSGRFTDIEEAPAGTVASPPSKLRLSPVAADREGEMTTHLWLGRISAFMRRHPALHGAIWGAGIATLLALLAIPLRDRLNDPLRRLRLAHRPFEARVVGLDYAPMRATRGSATDSGGAAVDFRVLSDLRTRVDEDRSPENLQRLAKAHLAYDMQAEALAYLEEAHRARPRDASILSDLAVAELASGRIADAAEHSAMALEYDSARVEAAFTWAMAMERFSNRPAAIQAWQRYLTMDAGGRWADEARQRLAALEGPRLTWAEERNALVEGADAATIRRLVAKYPYHTRLRVLNVLLPRWARSGDPRVFALMRAMAAERAASDPYLLDVVEHAGRSREMVVPGILAFRAGLDAFDAGRFDDAADLFSNASKIFESAGSPLWIISSINAANMKADGGHAAEAMTLVERIEARVDALNGRYPSMTSDTVWLHGLLQARGGFPALALDALKRAQAAAHRSGEVEQETAVQQLIASALEINGDPRDAEGARIAALRSSDSIGADRDRMFGAYADVAYAALRSGRPRVARAFAYSQMFVADEQYDALVRVANESDPSQREAIFANARETRDRWGAESDVRRALAVLDIGRADAATQAIASARSRAMAIASPGYRDRVLGDVDFATGLIEQRRGQTRAAIEAFTSAISIWERQGWRLHTATAYLARAEANRTAGHRRAAESDYRAGIEDMEAQRSGLEPELRIAYFERAERLFERLIELLLEDGRAADALTVAERKRARVLLDQVAAGGAATPLDAERIRTSLQSNEALLEITLLDKSAEAWLVYDGRITHARSVASRQSIESAVARHLAAIESDQEPAVKREGRWLYEQLLAPLVSALPRDTTLVIVPDGALHALPFAALVTPDDRYLLEMFVLPNAPSASVFLRRAAPHAYDSLFAVAQPQPGDLQRLPGAAAEAMSAAKQHERGRYAAGVAISTAEFLDEVAGDVACVHFAGHAKTDVDHPSRSALLFESAAGPAKELTASQIASRRLPSAPLVVLAACSTGRGQLRRNEGIQSLAAAFLQAGARGVVATLWDVDDALSAKLFRSFHQQLRAGARPADALRSAQRDLLHSNDPHDRSPAVWASAVVEGTR